MISRFSTALAAVVSLASATASFAAPAVTNVAPAEGTVGTQITITGTELGLKAPKAVLKLHGDATAKPIALKLTKPFDGTTVHASVLKIQPGVYDLVLTPSRGAPIVVDGAFTGRAPSVTSLSTNKIVLGDTIDILGQFFGSKRSKVRINNVIQKIKLWTDGKITVLISKKTGAGTFTFDVVGAGGTQTAGASADFVAPIVGADYVNVDFVSGAPDMRCRTIPKTANNVAASEGLVLSELTATKPFGGGLRTVSHQLILTLGGPLEPRVYSPAFAIFNEIGITTGSTLYDSQGAATWTVTIAQRVGKRISGTFSGGLKKTEGAGADTLSVSGDFVLTIP